MNHGAYWSYYATVHLPGTGCGMPISYDDPSSSLNLMGDCNTGENCLPAKLIDDENSANAKFGRKPHKAAQRLINEGIEDNYDVFFDLQPGAVIIGTGVNVIKFYKNPNNRGDMLLARVYVVKITPGEFEPKIEGLPPIESGLGHALEEGSTTPPDRSCEDGDVITIERAPNSRVASVLVRITPTTWREFQIVLRRSQGKPKEESQCNG